MYVFLSCSLKLKLLHGSQDHIRARVDKSSSSLIRNYYALSLNFKLLKYSWELMRNFACFTSRWCHVSQSLSLFDHKLIPADEWKLLSSSLIFHPFSSHPGFWTSCNLAGMFDALSSTVTLVSLSSAGEALLSGRQYLLEHVS